MHSTGRCDERKLPGRRSACYLALISVVRYDHKSVARTTPAQPAREPTRRAKNRRLPLWSPDGDPYALSRGTRLSNFRVVLPDWLFELRIRADSLSV